MDKTRWLILPFLVAVTLAIYYPVALHNLPVAANVDDRTSLAVLRRFADGSANPKFFMYPTLYYYLTYAVTAPFGFAKMLFAGRLLNLGFVALTAFLAYSFCIDIFRSRTAGIVAACSIIFSPSLIASGGYLCTDVLLSALTLLSVHLLIRYFQSGSRRDWFLAMLAVGGAIATKYTAIIIFIAYVVTEFAASYRRRKAWGEKAYVRTDLNFSRSATSGFLILVAVLCAVLAFFLPVQTILHFVAAHRTNVEMRSTREYVLFLTHLRHALMGVAAGAALLVIAARRSTSLYECISSKRPYHGLLLILLVSLLGTPFSVLDPGKFVYDIGALLKSNVVTEGDHQQWANYGHWLLTSENSVLVGLGVLGLVLFAYRFRWRSLAAFAYLTLYIVTICTSHLGTPRYLDPVLPLLYCGTGLMVMELWRWRPRGNTFLGRGLVCLLAIVVLAQLARRTVRDVKAASEHDAFFTSYEGVLASHVTGPIFYAGYAPNVELELAGLRTQAVSWASLASGEIAGHLACENLLILNKRQAAQNHLAGPEDPSLELILDDSRGQGQMLFRRRGCR